MSSPVGAGGAGGGGGSGTTSACATSSTAPGMHTDMQQQQQDQQDVPKVKIRMPGKNEEEVVVKRRGRFKILKDTAVTVVTTGPGGGSAATPAAAAPAAAASTAVTDGPTPGNAGLLTIDASSTAATETTTHPSARRSPSNKPPMTPSSHTRSQSDASAASGIANTLQQGVHVHTGAGLPGAAAKTAAASAAGSEEPNTGAGGGNERVLQAASASALAGTTGTSSAMASPTGAVETITPSASFSPSIQQPHLVASPPVVPGIGNAPVKQKGRFSITPASDGAAGLVGGEGGAEDPSAPSVGGGTGTSNKRPPQHLQQPRLPHRHQGSQDSEATASLPPSVDARPRDRDRDRDREETMQRSPKYGQSAEANRSQQQQQQQQQQQSKTNFRRQSLTQQQHQGGGGPQNVQENPSRDPSQPAGLFPEKHARAASADKAIGGGNIGAGRTGAQPGGLGKVFYFMDQMKMEVVEADRAIKSLQVREK